ncbi:DNA repair protein RecN [Barnesiella viscericola DSM 18177]|uniref:DNA repair protein RecN n=1 Tax=Barnesiella viscericola DSM 18177 TaxID=880074 RepID=W0ER18_9BACT|nr:DNA repair protein RecN [Barnesiella viscericola]AHF12003.1 DNA repair protein RecN [Barnesiella viscericola DSM 18177]
MIKKLSVSNYTLIDELHIDFEPGFSVITGETGAGKSIILGALSLILGQRADLKSLRHSDEKAVIEGVFDIASYHLRDFFDENELDYDEGECILRREILPSGKSRAFINDTPVSVAQLKALGEQLIDIHSQHQNLLLADSRFQLRVVDTMAGDAALLADYREHYHRWRERLQAFARLQEENRTGREEEDYLRYQLGQLDEAQLKEGEQEELEGELQTLQHAEEIKNELAVLQACLHGEETGVVSLLNAALSRMKSLSRLYPEVDEWIGRLESDYIDLKDIATTVDRSQENLNIDPERLAWVENRLDTYYSLQQKHRVSNAVELLALRDSFAERLARIENYDEELAALKRQVEEQEQQVRDLAARLTEVRQQSAAGISQTLTERVKPLGMPHLQFEIEVAPRPQLDETGGDAIRFLFSANKNQPLQPVSEVASGGEISRLMLSLKALVAHAMALPTIIFDEVDTGVSGEIADKMARIMREMAQCMQVISITHLPQVAAWGQTHYRVYKSDTDTATATHLVRLTDKQRVEEIARMLSGSSLTAAALDNARELLKRNELNDGKE